MTIAEKLTLVNIGITTIGILVVYYNYKHIREKDFHDNIYKIKLDSYKNIIALCHEAYKTLDINSTPFVQLYDIEENRWREYYEQEITKYVSIGFEIRDAIYKDTAFLPSQVMDEVFTFSENCLQFIAVCVHGNSEYIINKQDDIHQLYFNIINAIRTDLGIDIINDSLKYRLNTIK